MMMHHDLAIFTHNTALKPLPKKEDVISLQRIPMHIFIAITTLNLPQLMLPVVNSNSTSCYMCIKVANLCMNIAGKIFSSRLLKKKEARRRLSKA